MQIKELVEQIRTQISQDIFGHKEAIELMLGAFLIGAHCLIEGPPGVGKTRLAKTLANTLGLDFNRIQFTPDLMPSDISGVNIFDQQDGVFRFAPGPIFADIVLADEINRTPPKTQSALLEAMEEHFVTIDGIRHDLGEFFFVIATQNPVEHEGTFPLPEAQLDRFLFKVKLGYPEEALEEEMIRMMSGAYSERNENSKSLCSKETLISARKELRAVKLEPAVANYIQRLSARTRKHPDIALGASPRAALGLALAAKFKACLDGRDYCIPDDVKAMLINVFSHRLILQAEIYDQEEHCLKLLKNIADETTV